MLRAPLLVAASVLACSLVTVSLAVPLRVRVLLSAIAAASKLIVSPAPLALIVVSPVPVVMLMPLSRASPAFTVRLPLRGVVLELAPVRLPTKLFTTCLAAPKRLRSRFWGRLPASTVRVSLLLLPLTVVALLPVVIVAVLSATSP